MAVIPEQKKRTSLTKRLIFALVPTVMFFLLATIAIQWLEKEDVIDTGTVDDRITNPSGLRPLLTIFEKGGRQFVEVTETSVVQDAFPFKKEKETVRIFMFGGSFMMGSPYVHFEKGNKGPGTIPLWVKAELSMLYPDLEFQVVNFGSGGMNSTGVKSYVKKSLKGEPDLVIVASGNNEGFVPETPFNETLQKWVIYRSLKKSLIKPPKISERPTYAPQDPDTEAIERLYRNNIEKIITTCRENNVSLLLSTLPINLKYMGRTRVRDNIYWQPPDSDENILNAHKLYQEGNTDGALVELSKTENTAGALRMIAQIHLERKEYARAKEILKRFVQLMPLGRTRPSYNIFLRDITERENVTLVDLESHLEDISPHGISDHNLFVDHCHMTWWGHYLMAKELVKGIEKTGVIPAGARRSEPEYTLRQLAKANGWDTLYDLPDTRMPIILDDTQVGACALRLP